MISSKYYIFIWINLCFFFTIIFPCECQSEISTTTPEGSRSPSVPEVQNNTILSTPNATNITDSTTTSTTSRPMNEIKPKNLSDESHSSKAHDDCSNKDPLYLWLLCGFLFVSVWGLIFVAYFLYLKRIEVQSKLCPCRMQQMDSSTMDQPPATPEARYVLDPITVSKLLTHCNISISANSLNTTAVDTARNSNQPNAFADRSFRKRFSFRRGKKSSSDRDHEIAAMNVYKYLEYLKKKNENVYEEPKFQEPQYDTLEGLYEASTSGPRSSIPSRQLPSFMMNEIKNNKLSMNSTVRF